MTDVEFLRAIAEYNGRAGDFDRLEAIAQRLEDDEWKPIETAPEGVILVYMLEDTCMPIQTARWGKKMKVIGGMFHFDAKPATHWKPLPKGPL
jgi:hypothetical protein